MINLSDQPFTVNDGERIAQMVITQYTHVEWECVEELDRTKRGDGLGWTYRSGLGISVGQKNSLRTDRCVIMDRMDYLHT